MYKVAIADDEPVIRNGLASMIESENPDFKVVASFSSAEALIEYLKNDDVDVVFTDIVMYRLTGLDVAKYLHENKPYTKCVILSGYDRFDYAQSAISFNVCAYLLKPLDADALSDILNNISAELESFETDYDDENVFSSQLLSDIFTGVISNESQLRRRAAQLGYDPELFLLPCITLNFCFPHYKELLSSWKYEIHSLNTALYHFICEIFDCETFPLYNKDGKIIIVLLAQTDTEFVKAKINETERLFDDIFKTDFKCGVLCENNMMNIADNIDVSQLLSYIGNENEILCTSLATALFSGTFEEAESIFTASLRRSNDMNVLRRNVSSLFNELFSRLKDIKLPKHLLSEVNFYTLAAFNSIDELQKWGVGLLHSIYGIISQNGESTETVSIRNAKKYIEDNLHNDISLDDVASHVYLNPVYFSKLFKQSAGITFTSYVTQMRIEKAKAMLCGTDLKIYEISEKSGFRSTYYFNRVFKRIVGVTPNEFRRKE